MRLRATKLASFHHPQFRASELYAKAGELPSFDINPGELGHVRDLISGLVLGGGTVNSATPAWEMGPDGILAQPAANTPVIAYDPVTLRPLGLRVWQGVTNNFLQSENFATTWTLVGATVASDATLSPANTITADKIEETATTGQHLAGQVSAGGATTSAVTLSVFVKAAERTRIRLAFSSAASWSGGGGAAVIFNLSTGTATPDGSTPTAYGIAPYANGFYRCWITGTPTTSITPTGNIFLHTGVTVSYTGVAGNGVFLFGAQSNPGLIAPYVPTTTTTASSTADVITITGSDFARIYNQAAVTMYAEAVRDVVTGSDFPILIDARNANGLEVAQMSYVNESVVGIFARTIAAVQVAQYQSIPANTRLRRVATAFAQDNFAISANGQPSLVANSGAMPTPDRISIGSAGGGQFLNGYIRQLALFRSRRPNANLQALTS